VNSRQANSRFLALVLALTTPLGSLGGAEAAEKRPLYVGWARADITPPKPVNLRGQMYKRTSTDVHDPLSATVLALETRDENGPGEQAIMISCDLVGTSKAIQDRLRELIAGKTPDFDRRKLLMGATHTHTAPWVEDTQWDKDNDPGVMSGSQYGDFFLRRVSEAVVKAWKARQPAATNWALGQAVVGHNRRAHSFDGHTDMYGDTNREDFDCIEGYEDHGLEMLFFWDRDRRLTGMVLNVACPSQETENWSRVSADFWHDVREEIGKRRSADVYVFPQCGAAGDQSPHLLYRKAAEEEMLRRRGITRRQEIARRIADAVDKAIPLAEKDVENELIFRHTVDEIDLPVKEKDAAAYHMELHVMRLGDVAVATNPFELYLDYGLRIKARSRAPLTLVVQLSCQDGGYLPTSKAVAGKGYSAVDYKVGPEGGQVLVGETVRRINAMWEE
jgi:hypothetical protein